MQSATMLALASRALCRRGSIIGTAITPARRQPKNPTMKPMPFGHSNKARSPGGARAAEQVTLERFYSAVDGFVARLRAIRPPARVRALHGRLIGAMQEFGRSLRTAGAAIVSGNAVRILDGQQQLAEATSTVSHTIDTTVTAINAKLHG